MMAMGLALIGIQVSAQGFEPLADVVQTTAGVSHTCALTSAGAVLCTGENSQGQLGDGTTTRRLTPVAVSGLGSGVMGIAAGNGYSCAVTSAGAVLCWGENGNGQLGDGTTTRRLAPVAVSGLGSGAVAITTGNASTCALTSAGAVLCWGSNGNGQLGDGTTTQRLTPVGVSGLGSGVAEISAGTTHACAVTVDGAALCWGNNGFGQLGDGTTTQALIPIAVFGLSGGVASISAGGNHTCAVTGAGAALCWGFNGQGQLGTGSFTQRLTPTAVTGLASGVAAISAGQSHTCVVTNGGAALCWGSNSDGQLGDGTNAQRLTPVSVVGLGSGLVEIAASNGFAHTCAVTSVGTLLCWGNNSSGQLGDGTIAQSLTPVGVSGIASGATTIEAGASHTCAATSDGAVLCWGSNQGGQLGDGSTAYRLTPVAVIGLGSGVETIAAGGNHTCAATTAGAALCWGLNSSGEVGDGTTTRRLTPVAVNGLGSGVISMATGLSHTCAVTSAGAVLCWGSNGNGQLGDGTTTARLTPVAVSGLASGVDAIAAGDNHTCAATNAGAVLCWGSNGFGQLGDGTTTGRLTPVAVSGLSTGVAAVSAGSFHSCVVTGAGAALCWGNNGGGQLGDGTVTGRLTPVAVSGLSTGVAAVSAGGSHTCAVTSAGAALCWGQNFRGQLGDGSSTVRATPVAVSGLSTGVAALATGQFHSCAATSGGAALCWGWDSFGQLGDGGRDGRLPALVVVPVDLLFADGFE